MDTPALDNIVGLHQHVEIIYVVDGYEATLEGEGSGTAGPLLGACSADTVGLAFAALETLAKELDMNGTADNRQVSRTLDARPVPAVGQTIYIKHNGALATVLKVTRFPGDTLVEVRTRDGMEPCLFLDGLMRSVGHPQWLAP